MVALVAALALGPQRAAGLMRRIAGWLDSADSRWQDLARRLEGGDDQR
ncbi:MAG: hypothetical protein WC956_06435 [bacterium]